MALLQWVLLLSFACVFTNKANIFLDDELCQKILVRCQGRLSQWKCSISCTNFFIMATAQQWVIITWTLWYIYLLVLANIVLNLTFSEFTLVDAFWKLRDFAAYSSFLDYVKLFTWNHRKMLRNAKAAKVKYSDSSSKLLMSYQKSLLKNSVLGLPTRT